MLHNQCDGRDNDQNKHEQTQRNVEKVIRFGSEFSIISCTFS